MEPKDRAHLTHPNHTWCHLQMRSSQEELGAQEVCVGSGTPAGKDAASPDFIGPGPTPLKCSQPVKALLPKLKSIGSCSFSLGWETLGSSQNRIYWCSVVSGGPAKPSSQHLEHPLILQTDRSNPQACESVGSIPLKDLSPATDPQFPPFSK